MSLTVSGIGTPSVPLHSNSSEKTDFPRRIPSGPIDSISSAETTPSPGKGLFSSPDLSPPLFVIAVLEALRELGMDSIRSLNMEIESLSKKNAKERKDLDGRLQAAAAAAQNGGVWSLLQQGGSSILACYNLFTGMNAYPTTPVLATALVATGLLTTIANITAEKNRWDQAEEHIAKENKTLVEQMKSYSPQALQFVNFSLAAFAYRSISISDPVISIPNAIYQEIFMGSISLTSTFSKQSKHILEAEITTIQNTLLSDTLFRNSLFERLEQLVEQLEQIRKQATDIIQISTQHG